MSTSILALYPSETWRDEEQPLIEWARVLRTRAEGWTILILLMVGLVVCFSEGIQRLVFPAILGAGRFTNIGISYPVVMGPFVGTVEIVCGVLIILVLWTGLPLVVIMVVAIVAIKLPIWAGHDIWIFHIPKLARYGFSSVAHEARDNFLMLLGLIYLLIAGAGAWSLDAMLAREPEPFITSRGVKR
jgi:uncharacterized membrane protein YphA (DoxX/SURF4 family)